MSFGPRLSALRQRAASTAARSNRDRRKPRGRAPDGRRDRRTALGLRQRLTRPRLSSGHASVRARRPASRSRALRILAATSPRVAQAISFCSCAASDWPSRSSASGALAWLRTWSTRRGSCGGRIVALALEQALAKPELRIGGAPVVRIFLSGRRGRSPRPARSPCAARSRSRGRSCPSAFRLAARPTPPRAGARWDCATAAPAAGRLRAQLPGSAPGPVASVDRSSGAPGPAAAGSADRRLRGDDRRRLVLTDCRAGAARRARRDSAWDRTRPSAVPPPAVAAMRRRRQRCASTRWPAKARPGWRRPARTARHGWRRGRLCDRTAGGAKLVLELLVAVLQLLDGAGQLADLRLEPFDAQNQVGVLPLGRLLAAGLVRLLAEHAADRRQRRTAVLRRAAASHRKARRSRPLP